MVVLNNVPSRIEDLPSISQRSKKRLYLTVFSYLDTLKLTPIYNVLNILRHSEVVSLAVQSWSCKTTLDVDLIFYAINLSLLSQKIQFSNVPIFLIH